MDRIIFIILAALAAFRLAELLVYDSGPFIYVKGEPLYIFEYFRGWAFYHPWLFRNIGEALACVHCTGLYISAFFSIPLFIESPFNGLLSFLAIAGLQSILANRLGRRSN